MIVQFEDQLRIGTWRISKGFNRQHHRLLDLIKKHEESFLKLDNTLHTRSLIIRRVDIETAGRPVDEVLLNYNQVVLLMSLMRANSNHIKITAGIISSGTVAKALELIGNFDADDIQGRFVYAAVDSSGRVKIGISYNPERRLEELNIGNADNLKLIFIKAAEGQGYEDETELHNRFKRYRIRSEWFESPVSKLLCH